MVSQFMKVSVKYMISQYNGQSIHEGIRKIYDHDDFNFTTYDCRHHSSNKDIMI